MKVISDERFVAILALQNKQMQHLQGSYLYEIYDKAIDLALNPKRNLNEFFKHNLFRDAKRILKRRKKTAPEFVEANFTEIEKAVKDPLTELVDSSLNPLDILIQLDYYTVIYNQCRPLHPYALDVLDLVLAGVDIKDSARMLGLSESLVKKIRIQLKQVIQTILKN